ncbi:MAG: DNA internalization-related competence protein ComEC/Rec2 [Gammaproteobacteria bacterium]|nr:DNA internalization-related competence protein ComEC/Rec2 [Gammaproteobacteria bacterium]
MLKWSLGFLFGCCSIFWLSEPLSNIAWLITILLLVLLVAISGRIYDKSLTAAIFHCAIHGAIGFCLGLLWLNFHSEVRLKQRIEQPLPEPHIIEAKLVSIPQVYNELLQFKAQVLTSDNDQFNGKKLKISWYQYPQELAQSQQLPRLGEVWRMELLIKPISAALNIAGYDAEKQAFIENVAAKASIRKNNAIKVTETSSYSIAHWRQSIFEHLADFDNAGILQALLVGEKSNIHSMQRQSIQALGISHLLAISGLHISIIAGLVFWIGLKASVQLGRLGLTVTPLLFAGILSIVAALLYSALAGFSVATLRALIMWCAVVFSLIMANEQKIWRNLAIAVTVILIIDPLSVLSYGFWLTCIAIAIIASLFIGRVKNAKPILMTIKLQWYISLGMGLLVWFLFLQVSLVAFFINLLLIPVFGLVILPFIFLGFIVLVLFNSKALLKIIDIAISDFFQWFNPELLASGNLFFKAYLNEYLLLLLLMVYLLYLLPIGRIKVLPIIVLLVACFSILKPAKNEQYKLVVFDVGHGLANLIYNDQTAILYDVGYANDGFSYAEASLIPSLRKLGIKQLDLLVISHNDLDHSGGLEAITKAFKVERLVTAESCEQQNQLAYNDLQLSFYSAINSGAQNTNNQSCVLKITSQNNSVLLTGDIEKAAEHELLLQRHDLQANILLSPHHGSNTSSTYPFIKKVNADLVIHSTDRFNRYGFPKAKVVMRYQDMDYQQVSTGCLGMISINLSNNEIQKMRQKRRIWRFTECEV